jgi:hypothetical protein
VSAYKEACDGIGGFDAPRAELIQNLVQESRALSRVFAERELSRGLCTIVSPARAERARA